MCTLTYKKSVNSRTAWWKLCVHRTENDRGVMFKGHHGWSYLGHFTCLRNNIYIHLEIDISQHPRFMTLYDDIHISRIDVAKVLCYVLVIANNVKCLIGPNLFSVILYFCSDHVNNKLFFNLVILHLLFTMSRR